jgi:hypothetical protein
MRSLTTLATLAAILALVTAATVGATQALAHGQSVAADPSSAAPGATISVKGEQLGGNRDVPVVLIGMGKEIPLGTARTTPQGAIDAQFSLPKDLAPGTYALRAKGKEDADTDFTVAAMPSMTSGQMGQVTTATTATTAAPEIPVRARPVGELVGLIAVFGLLAGLGLFAAQATRERPDRKEAASGETPSATASGGTAAS